MQGFGARLLIFNFIFLAKRRFHYILAFCVTAVSKSAFIYLLFYFSNIILFSIFGKTFHYANKFKHF